MATYALISIRNERQRIKMLKEYRDTENKFLKEQKEMRRELKGILGQN